jgi:hypothetical protein
MSSNESITSIHNEEPLTAAERTLKMMELYKKAKRQRSELLKHWRMGNFLLIRIIRRKTCLV